MTALLKTKCFLIFICLLLQHVGLTQNPVNNVRIKETGNGLHILYDLYSPGKKYFDKHRRTKTRRFDIELVYSVDENKNFILQKNTTGDVGKSIPCGSDKKISWKPNSNFGLVGKANIEIKATPVIPKVTWGFSYTKNILNLDRYTDKTNVNKFQLNIFRIQKSDVCLLIPFSIIDGKSEETYSNFYTGEPTTITEKILGLTAGIGVQTARRVFTWYGSFGIMFLDTYNMLLLDTGMSFKVLEMRAFTIHIPISVFGCPGGSAFIPINTGFEIQF